jgi:hypothetical protein
LGGVESIVEQPAALLSLDPEERLKAGIKDNLVRYALGIEEAEDLIADLDQALAGCGAKVSASSPSGLRICPPAEPVEADGLVAGLQPVSLAGCCAEVRR